MISDASPFLSAAHYFIILVYILDIPVIALSYLFKTIVSQGFHIVEVLPPYLNFH